MTYIEQCLARARLPIYVAYHGEYSEHCDGDYGFHMWTLDADGRWDGVSDNIVGYVEDTAEATRAYLALVAACERGR